MGKVMVIGCGGVASVAIHKICQNDEVFSELCIASRGRYDRVALVTDKVRCSVREAAGNDKDEDHDCAGGCGQREGADGSDPEGTAGGCLKSCAPLPGSEDHGRLPGGRGSLY